MNNDNKINETAAPTPQKKAPKIPEAEILLNRQLEMKKTTKWTDFATVISFCLIVFILGVLFWVIPDAAYSDTEKRSLQQAPSLSWERTVSDTKRDLLFMTLTEAEKTEYIKQLTADGGEYIVFADEIGDYYADQFPFRDQLRVLKAFTEICMLKLENNDVLFTQGGYLIKKDTVDGVVQNEDGTIRDRTYLDAVTTVERNTGYVNIVQSRLPSDIKLLTAIAGRGVDVLYSKLPSVFPYESTHAEAYWKAYNDKVTEYGLNTVELRQMLAAKAEAGEYVYYKTDHHWTSLGAYYAYCEIMKAYGEEPQPLSAYEREVFSDEFTGTTFAKAGAALSGLDTIEFFRYAGDTDYTMTIPSSATTTVQGFYNYKYQSVTDKYSAFLGDDNMSNGGNNPITLITKNTDEPREKMILIKDSFGHSLAPFLAYHYDLIILDMRYYNGDMSEYLSDDTVTHMLIINNMETYMNRNELSKVAAATVTYYQQ